MVDLEAGLAAPPPLGRRTDAVTHGTPDMWQQYCIMSTPSLVYLFEHILSLQAKHGTQNIQNDCHQWLSDSFRVECTKFASDPAGGAYSVAQDS